MIGAESHFGRAPQTLVRVSGAIRKGLMRVAGRALGSLAIEGVPDRRLQSDLPTASVPSASALDSDICRSGRTHAADAKREKITGQTARKES